MNRNEDLDSLIGHAQAEDLRAFEQIVRRFETPIRAWAVAHAPPGVDADEVAQRTFIQAFNRLSDFQAGTNFQAWLFTIARYQLMTEATRARRLADYHSRFAPELLARELERCAQETPERTAVRLRLLQSCMAELGGQARQFLDWRYADEIPLQEMAGRTGRSVPAIKKQLFVLRQKLQACIERKLALEAGGGA
jgi:RNA polymerase sigma-70 factor (ECF subfamily)